MPDSAAPAPEHLYHDDFVRPHRRRPDHGGHRRRGGAAPLDDQRCETRPLVRTLTRERPRADHEARIWPKPAGDIRSGGVDPGLPTDRERVLFRDHEDVELLIHAIARLGPLRGRRVLEVGVGSGSLAIELARQGAEVICLDVSPALGDETAERIRRSGLSDRITMVRAPIETFEPQAAGLSFARFDLILGDHAMSRIEGDRTWANLARLLAPGAIAMFCEPAERLLEIARTSRRRFRHVRWTPYHLLGRLASSLGLSAHTRQRVVAVDRALLTLLPFTARLCRVGLIELGLPAAPDDEHAGTAS
jgi:predicted O-methyltransferase YrrM